VNDSNVNSIVSGIRGGLNDKRSFPIRSTRQHRAFPSDSVETRRRRIGPPLTNGVSEDHMLDESPFIKLFLYISLYKMKPRDPVRKVPRKE
jgi:hypothetical protein